MSTTTDTPVKAPTRLELYRAMLGCRIAEQRICDLARGGEIGGHHPGLNHEAIGVGVGSAVRFDDAVQPSYRSGAAVMHARGALTVPELVQQGFGLLPGPRDQHPGGPRTLRSTGIVGGQIPMATGVAFANKLNGHSRVVVSFIGDGASNEGAVHEAMNIAGVKDLPIVFVVENNGFGLSNRTSDSTRAKNLAARGAGYGIEAETVDGTDPTAVFAAATRAIERARERSLPTILELTTVRPGPHATGFDDPRTEEEFTHAAMRDCISLTRQRLIADGEMTAAEDEELVAELTTVVDEAVTEARAAVAAGRKTAPEARYSDAETWERAHTSAPPNWMIGADA